MINASNLRKQVSKKTNIVRHSRPNAKHKEKGILRMMQTKIPFRFANAKNGNDAFFYYVNN